MKQNYFDQSRIALRFTIVLALVLTLTVTYSQQSYTFTNANATGSVGPTQLQINTAYLSTNLNGSVTINPIGIQNWTVPITGGYRVEARGAKGGGTNGGAGAIMIGDFTLTAGQVVKILVGQMGESFSSGRNIGGGGGSYVVVGNNTIMVIAGGGGAASAPYSEPQATTAINGQNGNYTGTTIQGAGGVNGAGGGGASCRGGGGAGWLSNGAVGGCGGFAGNGGTTFVLGGAGGAVFDTNGGAAGGFGGGGSSEGTNSAWTYAGGGGGYSGGGGASETNTTARAGGGGSINNGINQTNTSGANNTHGLVIITELCPLNITASGSNSLQPVICSGNSLTLTTSGISNYNWSTGNTTSSVIVVSPSTTTVYSVSATTSLNCTTSAFITVTVNSGVPVLSVSNPSNSICLGRTATLTASGALSYTWTNGVVNGQGFTPNSTTIYTVTGQNGCGITTATTAITVAPLPVSVLANPTLVCQGYPALLTAVSGVPNYTWEPGTMPGASVQVAPQANIIYTVTASDGTCSGTATVEVQTKITPTITASASATNICEGEVVTLTASGAGGGGTYTWSPGGSNLSTLTTSPPASTLFIVSATNSLNCESSAQQVVIVNSPPLVQITASSTLVCVGNSITLTGIGNANAYSWVGGPSTASYIVNPSGPTVYTLTGTHQTNTCVATRTIAASAVVPNVIVPASIDICSGSSGTIIASGATTYSFNGINVGANGNFVVAPQTTTSYTLLANTQNTVGTFVNCPTTHTVLVNVNPNPTITVVATRTFICKGTTNTLTASGALTYDWGTAGTGSVVVVSPPASIVYTVVGKDVNGCEHSILFQTIVGICPGISENNAMIKFVSVFPNPNNGSCTVKSDVEIRLRLLNQLGQEIGTYDLISANGYQIAVKGLSPGVYFLTGEHNKGNARHKIVVTD